MAGASFRRDTSYTTDYRNEEGKDGDSMKLTFFDLLHVIFETIKPSSKLVVLQVQLENT